MKIGTSVFLFLILCKGILGQEIPNHHFCASDVMQNNLFYNHPEQKQKHELFEKALTERLRNGVIEHDKTILTIPVVVHIIHQSGPENISDLQVEQAIQYLNDAFSNEGSYSSTDGVDVGIRFCLAIQTEDGELTTGIVRVPSPLTNMTMEVDDDALKNLSYYYWGWYVNIWVVNSIDSQVFGSNVAGYAYFPSSHGTIWDGVVIEADCFGTTAEKTSVLAHELGHYLGLYHTFENTCQNDDCLVDGDRVCDTPPDQSTAIYNCTGLINTCTTDENDLSINNPFRPIALGGKGDANDLISNFMDYGNNYCFKSFTSGQKNRMLDALQNERQSLLYSLGCDPYCSEYIWGDIMSSTHVDSFFVGDQHSFFWISDLENLDFIWEVNGIPVGEKDTLDFIFTTPGEYTISVTVSNGFVECTIEYEYIVTINCTYSALISLNTLNPKIGETVYFTNLSSPSLSMQWFVDGVLLSSSIDFQFTFNETGSHSVYLVVSNGNCIDTSRIEYIHVGTCGKRNKTVWYTTHGVIDFGYEPPLVLDDTYFSTSEGHASANNLDGQLLFFTNGVFVVNAEKKPMLNGQDLFGSSNSTQSAVVLQDPGNENEYYIFTVDAEESDPIRGLCYSKVNMNGDHGLGEILPTQKNVQLHPDCLEKLAIVKHRNNCDYWIISHINGSTSFVSYLVTDAGIITTPVVSNAALYHIYIRGGIRVSPDGTKLVSTWEEESVFDLYDFNNLTGQISNRQSKNQPNAYGIEFSADNSKLYVSSRFIPTLYQYKLDQQPLTNGYELLCDGAVGALQMGPNGKIFIALPNQQKLPFITYPNLEAPYCQLNINGIETPYYGSSGLPDFPSGYFQNDPVSISGENLVCSGVTEDYQISPFSCKDSTAIWNISGNAIITNFSDQSCSVKFNGIGDVSLVCTKYSDCGVVVDTFLIKVVDLKPSLGPDVKLCSGTELLFTDILADNYLWNDNSNNTSLEVSTTGIYWVETSIGSGNCLFRDSIFVQIAPEIPISNLGNDTTICLGAILNLELTTDYDYLWMDNSNDNRFTIYQPGSYWVKIIGICGDSIYDTIVVSERKDELVNLGNDLSVCDKVLLEAGDSLISYIWQDNSGQQNFLVDTSGTYFVTVTDSYGCSDRDTVNLQVLYSPLIELGENQIYCSGDTPIELSLPNLGYSFLWQDGSNLATMLVTQPGIYSVEVSNSCKTVFDAIEFDCPLVIPDFFTPQNDGMNDVFFITGIENEVWEFRVLNRWGNVVYQNEKYQNDWSAQGLSAGVYFYRLSNKIMDKHYEGYLHIFK